jgi:hypothetical protein
VFTLPPKIGAIAYPNKAVIYDLLFKASAEPLARSESAFFITSLYGLMTLGSGTSTEGSDVNPITTVLAALAIILMLPRPASAQSSPKFCYSSERGHRPEACGMNYERCQRSVRRNGGGRCISDPRK